VLTVVESPIFQKLWPIYWSEDEVRWSRPGTGKSGGVRGVYVVRNEEGEVYLLTLFAKSEKENIPLAVLKEIRRALEI
jgi:hypothetical protein